MALRKGDSLETAKGPQISAFAVPVVIDGIHCVDGALHSGFPVEIARKLGCDLVIAVEIKRSGVKPDFSNPVGNLQLAVWALMESQAEHGLGKADVVINPDVKYGSYMDYGRSYYFIREGYEAGQAAASKIKSLLQRVDSEVRPALFPYRQPGFSSVEITKRLTAAATKAASVPTSFRVAPILEMEFASHELPGLGLYVTGGRLARARAGYLYKPYLGDMLPDEHKLFLTHAWRSMKGEVFLRYRCSWDQPSLGMSILAGNPSKLQVTGTVESKDSPSWELRLDKFTLWQNNRWQLATEAALKGSFGSDSIDSAPAWELSPEVRWLATDKAVSILELLSARPYIFAGADATGKFAGEELKMSYRAGLGADSSLFGLYPFSTRLELKTSEDGFAWRFGVKGGLR